MVDKLIEDVRICANALQQKSIFSDSTAKENLKAACVKYLNSEGYVVVIPKTFSKTIKNTGDLVTYFYALLANKHPDNYMAAYSKLKDMATAKRFVQRRMEITGFGKAYALNECGEIVKTVVDNEEVFKFTNGISFHIFGQANMVWVTDKALKIMNVGLKAKEEIEEEIIRERMIASQDTADFGFGDLDEILTKMESNNG